jgi:hypothetical protein
MHQPRFTLKTPSWMGWEHCETEAVEGLRQWREQETQRLAATGRTPNSRLRRAFRHLNRRINHLQDARERRLAYEAKMQPLYDRVAAAVEAMDRAWARTPEARELEANERIAEAYGF